MTEKEHDIHIRCADLSDLDEVLPLVRDYHTFESIELSEEQRKDAVGALLGDASLGSLWMVNSNERLAGYVALCYGFSIEFSGRDAFVDEFFLRPEYRGQGIGREVLIQLVEQANALNLRALHLEVERNNSGAIRLYRSQGFKARGKYQLMSYQITPGMQ